MKPENVDKLICDWSVLTGHSFKEHELNNLVDLISAKTELEVLDLRAEVDLARERLGPAGLNILKEILYLRTELNTAREKLLFFGELNRFDTP